jgi:UDP-3-O-[3-hydroxymyristoyl] glucosamine N-acyltransferase
MVAMVLKGQLVGPQDLPIADFAGLDQAREDSLTFIRSGAFALRWPASKARVAVVTRGVDVPGHDPAARALIFVDSADLAIAQLLSVVAAQNPEHRPAPGVHPTAVVDPSARVDPSVRVGPMCVIGPGCVVEPGVTLHARVVLGASVRVGEHSVLHPGVVVYDRCTVGKRNLLHANVSIGADGFGFLPDPANKAHVKIPHIGAVILGDDVEIGANSCVDRGKFGPTLVGDHVKIDNLCQIGHNVRLGRAVLVCGASAIGGSCDVQDHAVLGGKVGIVDGLTIGAGAQIAAGSGVMNDIKAGETWFGYPAMRQPEAARNLAGLRRLAELIKTVRRITKALDKAGISVEPPDETVRLPGRR